MPETPDPVPTLIALAQVDPPDAEVAALRDGFAAQRSAIRALYAVTEARYEEPALIFSARP